MTDQGAFPYISRASLHRGDLLYWEFHPVFSFGGRCAFSNCPGFTKWVGTTRWASEDTISCEVSELREAKQKRGLVRTNPWRWHGALAQGALRKWALKLQREEEEAALIIINLFLDNNPIKHPDIVRLDREDTQPSGDQTPSWLGSWGPRRLPLAVGGQVASCFCHCA